MLGIERVDGEGWGDKGGGEKSSQNEGCMKRSFTNLVSIL